MKSIALLLNIASTALGLFACFASLFSVMMFDAPGSDKNPFIWGAVLGMLALPVIILASQIVSWRRFARQNYRGALLATAIPVGGCVAWIVGCWVLVGG